MTLRAKQFIIALLGFTFLLSLVFVQWMEVTRKREELGLTKTAISVPDSSRSCVQCHDQISPGIVSH